MRRLLAASAVAFACLAPASPAAPAAADPVADCTPGAGVLVAVDFGHWGGAVERGCDGTPTTGYDALHTAGFTTQGDQRDGPAFMCRINGLPSAADDPCVKTPPSSASWSYWHADAGQPSWSYSATGATSSHPGAGSIDAWTFGGGTAPTFTPAQVRAGSAAPGPAGSTPPSTSPSSTAPSSAAPTSAGATAGPGSAGATSTAAPTSRRPSTAHPSTAASTRPTVATTSSGAATNAPTSTASTTTVSASAAHGSSSATPNASPSTTASDAVAVSSSPASPSAPTIVDVASSPAVHSSSGSVAPAIIGIAIAVVLGAATFVAVRRRRTG